MLPPGRAPRQTPHVSRVRGLSGGVAIGAITTLLLGIARGSWSLGAPAASVAVTGGYGGEQAVVRQLVGAIRPRTIADVRIGRPRYVGERREPRERTLFISVRSSRPAALARAWWEAGLLAAAARDLDRSRGLPAVGMVELFARAPDGERGRRAASASSRPASLDRRRPPSAMRPPWWGGYVRRSADSPGCTSWSLRCSGRRGSRR